MQNVVLITGASSGIGKSIGEYLARFNYKVYGTSRTPKHKELNGIHFLQLDVTQQESIKTAVETLIAKEGQINFLINNAGVGITGPLEEIPDVEQRKIFETNYFGPLKVINTVLPHMRSRQSGFIINITSIAGHMGLPFRGFYSASKGALELTTEAYRMELKAFGIKMTNVAPGDFATNIAAGRFHAPVQENSPYKAVYERSLKLMNEHVNQGKDPNLMAKSVHAIMQKSNPKIHYKVGDFTQKISVFLKHILPDKVFEKLLLKHYKL
ncbi:SDR family oxidoreductase [Psychroflexus sp. YR1-1]|uniref:SDR family oxidoreductase n=1 Tax=Psychroflexus aurantiacus TaxID=2709310 RepID=A0A6B3QYB8_9FLAO|nr:SDR family oxidoreductase [Psychroflexus aurantiacus]NEV93166.1 SDR family oxidoreductase [Psychroflexus aurantiacus]